MKRISHWINGGIVAGTSGRTGPVWNPATGEQQAEVELASAEEVDAVVANALRRLHGAVVVTVDKAVERAFDPLPQQCVVARADAIGRGFEPRAIVPLPYFIEEKRDRVAAKIRR